MPAPPLALPTVDALHCASPAMMPRCCPDCCTALLTMLLATAIADGSPPPRPPACIPAAPPARASLVPAAPWPAAPLSRAPPLTCGCASPPATPLRFPAPHPALRYSLRCSPPPAAWPLLAPADCAPRPCPSSWLRLAAPAPPLPRLRPLYDALGFGPWGTRPCPLHPHTRLASVGQ
nr:vegetative cell wall protein gp1-like [Aegilops tauschii subsp. strangulata]